MNKTAIVIILLAGGAVKADDFQAINRGRFGTGAIGIPHCYDTAPRLRDYLAPYQGRSDISPPRQQTREELLAILAILQGEKAPQKPQEAPKTVIDVLRDNCYECHSGARNDGGIDLVEWNRFDCDKKKNVLFAVTQKGDRRMPLGRAPLTREEINLIAEDIAKHCDEKPETPKENDKTGPKPIDTERILSILEKERVDTLKELKAYIDEAVKGAASKSLEPIEFDIEVEAYRKN